MAFTGSACLRFYVYMYGSDVGTLNVYVKNDQKQHQLYRLMGNQGDAWKKNKLTIEHSEWRLKSNISLIFEAIRGDGYKGDIALDVVEIEDGVCRLGK